MCGRFFMVSGRDEIEARFDVFVDIEYSPNYNSAPQQDLYIIPNTDLKHLQTAKWGFPLQGRTVINVRVESAQDKAMFSDAMKERRCLVIANGFIEWKDGQPFKITYAENKLIAFAGIWEKQKIDGKEHVNFVILTRDAEGEMKKYHTRMPITLNPQHEKEWLTTEDPLNILNKFLTPTEFKPLDKKIGNVRNNTPELLKPLSQLSF